MKTVDVRGHDTINSVDISDVTLIDQALPTSRLLDGSCDAGAYAEYIQPCVLPDGTDAHLIYILYDDHVCNADGETMEDEGNYDWDSAMSRIIVR
jgi:hypothetical protein